MRIISTITVVIGSFIGCAHVRGDTILPSVSTVVTSPNLGVFNYSYTLSNNALSSESLFVFALYQVQPVVMDSVTTPLGWTADLSDGVDVIWTSDSQPFDIAAGTQLTGFGFQSNEGPGQVVFAVFGSDAISGIPTGDLASSFTTGPVAIPEPNCIPLVILGLALAFTYGRLIRRPPDSRRLRIL